jgi:cytochrome oxidase Cu insertion factor (SCO1/SenC/PrrC family)
MKPSKIITTLLLVVLVSVKTGYARNVPAFNFTLPNEHGKMVSLSGFKGKVVVLDFWFTGCINCINFYQAGLSKAETHFAGDPRVVFISICIDKDKKGWLGSLEKGRYTSRSSIHLYTNGDGDKHQVIKKYQVIAYPQPVIIGKTGEILSRSGHLTDGDMLIKSIREALK